MPKNQEFNQLLADLAQMAAWAEWEDVSKFPKTFHPVPEHIRAFDPSVILVIGPRGSGKSELFRAVIKLNLMPAIQRCLPEVRLPFKELERIFWIAAYPAERDFPGPLELARFILEGYPNFGSPPMEIWFAYLVRSLWDHLMPEDQEALKMLKDVDGGDVDNIYNAFISLKNAPQLALDHLDAKLEKEDRFIFVGYDELDTLGAKDWEAMSHAISGLVAFWAAYTRRWRRVRAKIFLRTDLFARYAKEGGPDLAKLAANRVELYWSDKSLYAVLLKRIANQSEDLWQYVKGTRGIEFFNDPVLGQVPRIKKAEDVKPLIKRMIGEFMGATFKKGYTHRWLLNHIRDGRGQALPRPMVRMIALAADVQKNSLRKVQLPRLVDHISLRRALDRVSEEHVSHSESEWPWLDRLRESVKGQQVPLERESLEEILQKKIYDGKGDLLDVLPTDNAEDLVDYLVEVGIFRERTGKKIDVPDLFLSGLGLKRKGGVRKK
jgi:hypothetical protein